MEGTSSHSTFAEINTGFTSLTCDGKKIQEVVRNPECNWEVMVGKA
jgi:hypothetical protein